MRNKWCFSSILLLFLLIACNVPTKITKITNQPESIDNKPKVIWDLGTGSYVSGSFIDDLQMSIEHPTSTPQLFRPVNFDEAFPSNYVSQASAPIEFTSSGADSAQWLYFSPGEYTTGIFDKLYTAFTNTGEAVWDSGYALEFYAGVNPSKNDRIPLSGTVYPGDQAVFEIPVSLSEPNWKACWNLMSRSGESLYDFCYSHGNGTIPPFLQSAGSSSPGSSNADTSNPFYLHEGTAPAKFSNEEFSADLLSTKPATGHDFKAYDHYEQLSASFRNNGTAVWDSSYSLVFYAGYNWMHANSFPLFGTTYQGEAITITMPMEIFEDNDRWYTCWYLASPDGKNLADFCFKYSTSS